MRSKRITRARRESRHISNSGLIELPRDGESPQGPTVRVLESTEWSLRHGTDAVKRGKLRAFTDTDYLVFECPSCGVELRGGCGVGLEGVSPAPQNAREIPVLLFRLDCLGCGFRDFFKIALDDAGRRYGTGRVAHPLDWPRPGRLKPRPDGQAHVLAEQRCGRTFAEGGQFHGPDSSPATNDPDVD